MNIDFIKHDLENTMSYFKNPRNGVQAGRLYQAEKTLNQINQYLELSKTEKK